MHPLAFELKTVRNGSILILWLCGRMGVEHGDQIKRLELEISKQEVDHVLLDLSRLTHAGAGILPALERLVQETQEQGIDMRICLLRGDLKIQLAELAKAHDITTDRRRAA